MVDDDACHTLTRCLGKHSLRFVVTSNMAKRLLFAEPTVWSGVEGYLLTGDMARVFNVPVTQAGLLVQRVARGSLGTHVLRHALGAGHDVSVLVRDASRLPAEARQRAVVHTGDLSLALQSDAVRGHDALINCAGNVADGEGFVSLVDRVIASVESLPVEERPVCWFLAGAALLDIDASGRRGVELPKLKSVYWPHRANFERLERSSIDWRLLCPGPMVDQPPLGLERLRISLDRLPVEVPAFARALPGPLLLPMFASLVPQMIVPYEDAAALMLANLDRGSATARHRVGLALPVGIRGRKPGGVRR